MRFDKCICKITELNRDEMIGAIQHRMVRVDGNFFTNGATQVHENNPVTLGDFSLTLWPFFYMLIYKPANTCVRM